MSFESIWYGCACGAVVIGAVWWAIAYLRTRQSVEAAITRIARQQEEILRYVARAAASSATADAILCQLQARYREHAGAPPSSEVIAAADDAPCSRASRLSGLDTTSIAGAHLLAGSIATSMPHWECFSDWHKAWRAEQAESAGRQASTSPGLCRSDPAGRSTPLALEEHCRKLRITVECTPGAKKPWPPGWPQDVLRAWTVTISRPIPGGKRGRRQGRLAITTPFFRSTDQDGEPTAAEVLSCLLSDASVELYGSFEDWAAGVGCDPACPKAQRTYLVCLVTALRLRAFLGDDDELLRQLRCASGGY